MSKFKSVFFPSDCYGNAFPYPVPQQDQRPGKDRLRARGSAPSRRTDSRRRLTPALTDLAHAIQPTLEAHPESGAGPTHTKVLGALDLHETDIRECGQFLSDVAAEVSEAASRFPHGRTGWQSADDARPQASE